MIIGLLKLCKLIDEWPNWPDKWLNIFGKISFKKKKITKILEKKIKKNRLIDAKNINNKLIEDLINFDCLIIDNYNENIEEKLLYSLLNQAKQLESYVLINSISSIKDVKFNLNDLKSRIDSFMFIGIELPNDDILRVIIAKNLSEKQIRVSSKLIDFIINNVERSYEKMFKFMKDLDELSLSTGKSININLIKKVLNK